MYQNPEGVLHVFVLRIMDSLRIQASRCDWMHQRSMEAFVFTSVAFVLKRILYLGKNQSGNNKLYYTIYRIDLILNFCLIMDDFKLFMIGRFLEIDF